MAHKPLNARQVEVLQWIADGCPEGVMKDETYKLSAAALKSRRLAKVSKRGGWHAEITDDGRYYLEHGVYLGEPAKAVRPRPTRTTRPRPEKPEASALEMPEMSPAEVEPLPAATVQVPTALRNPHPVIAALRDESRRLGLTSSVRGRALRVLQAIATEAERRGWSVCEVKMHRNEYGYTWLDSNSHLIIETGEARVGVRILQQTDRSPHEPTAEELDRQKRWGSRPPKYDQTPNDYLRIEIDSRWNGRQHSWSGGKRGPIDRKLPAILDEIEMRHDDARERRLEEQRIAEEREQRRLEAVERAKVMLRESHRAEVLAKQVADWRYAEELREYVKAMRVAVESITDTDEQADARLWLRWACDYPDRVDPLMKDIRVPDDPTPTDEALRSFLPRQPRRDWE
ncbi:MAG: hypothetical protein RBS17_04960 [Coriobacteriia bacterium]|nr:hypothetical protein [Coriobacteriia bacterium]